MRNWQSKIKKLKAKSNCIKEDSSIEAIIEKEVFEKVQHMQYMHKKKREKTKKEYNPLTGKIFCGSCQKRLQIRKEKLSYFFCTTQYIADAKRCVKKINTNKISQIIQQIFLKIMEQNQLKEKITAIQMDYCRKKKKQLQEEMKYLKAEEKKLIYKKKKEYETYLVAGTEKEAYLKWKNPIKKREKEVNWLLKQYQEKIVLLENIEQKNRYIFTFYKEIAEAFIEKILIFEEEKIVIYWKFEKNGNEI